MKGIKFDFSPEQERWLSDHYPIVSNEECARHMGCSPRTVIRKAHKMGLRKTEEFMEQSWRKGVEAMRLYNTGEGNRGKANLLKYGVKYRFKKGETSRQRLGDEKEEERLRKMHDSRRKTVKSERARINWGFEQKTKLRLVRQPQQWVSYRCAMKRRGYIVTKGAREIYFNDNTNRSALVEKNAQAAGLIIKQAI